MLYMRGHSKDYDEWRDMGLEGWGWDDVLPYFKKSENMSSDIENREKFHGTDGPLGVTKDNYKGVHCRSMPDPSHDGPMNSR